MTFFDPDSFSELKFQVYLNIFRGEYSITENGTIEVCVHGRAATYDAMFDVIDRIISFTLNLVSIFSLTTTLITYLLFKELRNLPGLNLMCLAVSILISRVSISNAKLKQNNSRQTWQICCF